MGLLSNNIESLLITIAAVVIVFLILREVFCWYWKINQRISLQKEQNELLKKIVSAGKQDVFDWEKSDSPKTKTEIEKLYDLIEKKEENIDNVAEQIQHVSHKTESQIKDFLSKYEQEKGKTLYQHLIDLIKNKDEVDKLLEPITKKIGE
ncbi:MAG: hypothetical protein PF541_15300 [Prolixibacteraceae bacterium]|jgi:hypothetical protein|nr:hypothetical protein [Prolixibacteraceae bacterium]